jgi:hypothetical protein
MKDTRFIELINLYVDRQISPEETAELEIEIQANPKRRQVYQQYCHMHRATKLVYESFRTHADQPAGATVQPGSIAYFAQRRQRVRRNFWLSAVGGLAAAACAAVYFVRADAGRAVQAVDSTATVVAVAPKPVAIATNPAAVQRDYDALLTAMHQTEPRAFAITQSQPVRPVSLFDDGVFEAKPDLSPDARRVFPVKAKADKQQAAEFTAFQFQR